jgi:hypothetical protein
MPKLRNRATNVVIAACVVVALLCPVIWHKAATSSPVTRETATHFEIRVTFKHSPLEYIPFTPRWELAEALDWIQKTNIARHNQCVSRP